MCNQPFLAIDTDRHRRGDDRGEGHASTDLLPWRPADWDMELERSNSNDATAATTPSSSSAEDSTLTEWVFGGAHHLWLLLLHANEAAAAAEEDVVTLSPSDVKVRRFEWIRPYRHIVQFTALFLSMGVLDYFFRKRAANAVVERFVVCSISMRTMNADLFR